MEDFPGKATKQVSWSNWEGMVDTGTAHVLSNDLFIHYSLNAVPLDELVEFADKNGLKLIDFHPTFPPIKGKQTVGYGRNLQYEK